MSDEATEEKKGKKKKEKKPKKEKPPKEKKPKKEKPKKEKKPKKGKEAPEGAEGAEAEEGGKKKGPPLLLILIPAFVVLIVGVAAVVIFVVLPKLRGGKAPDDEIPDDPDAALSAQVENTERAKGDKSENEDAEASDAESAEADAEASESADGEEGADDGAEASPPEQEKSVDIVVSMTTSESIAYFRSLPPEALGLPGESMDEYDIFASEHLILVDGVPCKEFHVYSMAGKAGTNDVQGLYLLTQRGARKIYRLDEATNTVTELDYKPPAPAQPEPEPVPEGDELPEGETRPEEEEPPDHM